MKILTPIGSKERFLEMYQGVNKFQLNEVSSDNMQTGSQLIEKAFNELKNKEISIKQTNTQTVDDGNFVEIITNDNNGNEISFTFKINSTEGDQDGVYNVGGAVLTEFKVVSDSFNVDFPENMNAVKEFNNKYSDEIMGVVEQYADFETDSDKVNVDDEIYEEAIGLIDKIPFKKGSEEIQTHSAYADEKPTNPDLRVQSDELEQFVSEMEKYVESAEDELNPEDFETQVPTADDGTKGIDPYDQAMADAQAGKNDWEISGKKLPEPKNPPPYMEKTDKKRAVPSWAEDFMENDSMSNSLSPEMKEKYIKEAIRILKTDTTIQQPDESYITTVKRLASELAEQSSIVSEENHVIDNINVDDIINRNYNKLLSFETKEELIFFAKEILENKLGAKKFEISKDEYYLMVKKIALQLSDMRSQTMNEDSDKDNYPDQIGKKFKPKNQFPKKKKKPQSVVKLGEEDEPIKPTGEYGSLISGNNIDNDIDIEMEDNLEGGLADDKSVSDFDPKQLAMGLEVELEHTDDPKLALEIAMDHLVEIPDYYTHLDKMEREAGVEEPENPNLEDEETDELLGYKPHNVNDYTNEDMDDYAGDIGDRYQDADGNQLTVKGKDDNDGTVSLQGQEGEKEVDTSDLQLLKKISEEKEDKKDIITEEQIKVARQVLKDRDFSNNMTKSEAVKLLIKHNIR